MIEIYLSRLNHYTTRLDVLLSLKQTPAIKREVTTCKREITYNRNRLGSFLKACNDRGVTAKCANGSRKTGQRF